ncbi:MAG: hypothetical protein JSV81_21985 [Anaerolineales bacterium]|nr:MAG: hypothetical protein JSV81_21985 [Anaerolineales bacterium]
MPNLGCGWGGLIGRRDLNRAQAMSDCGSHLGPVNLDDLLYELHKF